MASGLRRLLGYPARYSAALRERRRVRALPPELPFDDALAYAVDHVGITQKPDEIRWLFELVRELQPRVVLEIGLDEGGTFFLWTRAAAPDAQLVAIDTRPPGALGLRSPFPLVRRAFARGKQRVDLLMAADSHDPATVPRVERLLGGRPVDFLFIDGDHSYDGVWADFRMYSPLVRPGGIVAFHDVAQETTVDTVGTARFWKEFSAERATEERVAGGAPGFGIGVYRLPASRATEA